jgi:CBS-domain-containing membrane protein
VPGKADWLARGLPREGSHADAPRAIDLARQDAATCGLTEAIGAVRERVDASPYDFALVLAAGRVLLGLVRGAALRDDATVAAESVMQPGPSTVRADADPHRLRERLERQHSQTAIVTDPDGRLLGVVRRTDLPAP